MRNAIILAAVLVSGCVRDPTMQMHDQTIPAHAMEVEDGSRVSVSLIGVFADELAYSNRRGIYVIRDTETGQEFIGVSGIGITEIGRHSCGKGCSREDER